SLRALDGPVKLRREIVAPALVEPLLRISVKLAVGIEAGDALGISWAPDAEGADAELHPLLLALDAVVDALDEGVDVLAAPVVAGEGAAGVFVGVPGGIVGEVEDGGVASAAPIAAAAA